MSSTEGPTDASHGRCRGEVCTMDGVEVHPPTELCWFSVVARVTGFPRGIRAVKTVNIENVRSK